MTTPDPKPPTPTGNGQVMEHIRRLWAAFGRARIVRGIGYTVTETPAGTSLKIETTTSRPTTSPTSDGGVWI